MTSKLEVVHLFEYTKAIDTSLSLRMIEQTIKGYLNMQKWTLYYNLPNYKETADTNDLP